VKRISVRRELQTSAERAFLTYYDRRFEQELHKAIRAKEVKTLSWEEDDEVAKGTLLVVVRRRIPEWATRIVGPITPDFTITDRIDKKKLVHEVMIASVAMPDRIHGKGRWSIEPGDRPGWVVRVFEGEVHVKLPMVARMLEDKLAKTLQSEFERINDLIAERIDRDNEALAQGRPLPPLDLFIQWGDEKYTSSRRVG